MRKINFKPYRRFIDDVDPWTNLRSAIILLAISDYINGLISNNTKWIDDCESFFNSSWGDFVCNGKCQFIIEQCHLLAKKKTRKKKTPKRFAKITPIERD